MKKENSYITINKSKRLDAYKIVSKHRIFNNEEIRIDVFYDSVIFSIPDIDYAKRTYKPSVIDKKYPSFKSVTVTNEMLTDGKFFSDIEGSNEDQLLIYIR